MQAFLLIAQARCPMTVGDDQQQGAFTPGGDVTMFAGRRLQLVVEQALPMGQTLGLDKMALSGLLTQQDGGARAEEGGKP